MGELIYTTVDEIKGRVTGVLGGKKWAHGKWL